MPLLASDKEQLDEIFDRVMEKRLLRTSIPQRDEEMIVSVIKKWEDRVR